MLDLMNKLDPETEEDRIAALEYTKDTMRVCKAAAASLGVPVEAFVPVYEKARHEARKQRTNDREERRMKLFGQLDELSGGNILTLDRAEQNRLAMLSEDELEAEIRARQAILDKTTPIR